MHASELQDTASLSRFSGDFALKAGPFGLTAHPAFYFNSRSLSEALRSLRSFLYRRDGFALVYGDAGTGKTLLCKRFLEGLDRKAFNVGLMLNPTMNVDEFLMEMLRVFDMTLPCPPTKGTIFETLRSLVEREGTRGRQSVLAIDGAQRLSDEVLDLLPKQADAKSKGGSPLRVVLFAREELVTRLVDPGMRHLRRRITMTHCLQPLSSDEIGPYLVHRVAAAGSPGLISFSRGALERIYRASGGRARIVNVVSDRCLLMLRQPPRTTVTRRIVDQVLRDVGIHTVPKGKGSAKGRLTIVRLALASAVLALILCGSLIVLWPALGF